MLRKIVFLAVGVFILQTAAVSGACANSRRTIASAKLFGTGPTLFPSAISYLAHMVRGLSPTTLPQ